MGACESSLGFGRLDFPEGESVLEVDLLAVDEFLGPLGVPVAAF